MKKLFMALMLLAIASPAWSADVAQWRGGNNRDPLKGTDLISNIDNYTKDYAFDPLDRMISNYRQGQVLTYNSASDLVVTAGEIVVADVAGTTKLILQNASNTTITWTNIDTGVEASSTTYYVYAVGASNSATAVTYLISLSASAPTGATYYKRIGSFYNDSSSNIVSITNDNNFYASGFGTWSSKSSGANYQALTDGIACGYSNIGVGSNISGYTDSNSTPSTIRVTAGPATDQQFGFCMPVKKNDYYRYDGAMAVYFLSLGN